NSASKEYPVGSTIPANTLCVKDAVGNITIYGSAITLEKMGPPYRGIDVSAHQGLIDWPAVKASGVDYAIIRAMTWSQSVGYYVMDPYFDYNVRNAKANGIKVGAYIYTYAFNTNEITDEVNFFHYSAEMQGLRRDNIKFDYPVYIDVEYNKMLDHANYNERTDIVRLGMILLEKYGYYPGFYSNQLWLDNYYNGRALFNEGYHFWFARYPASPVPENGTAQYIGIQAQMWQYASDGRVNGIGPNVDVNMCYFDYSKLIGGGGSPAKPVSPKLSVYDLNRKAVVSGSINDIIAQIVANEVPGFTNAEVYKAQAVAAYSWVLYQQQHGDAIPKVGLKAPSWEIVNAVNSVSGKALYYNGAVANAAYGSASANMTNTASAMWGLNLPYLNTPVFSPESQWRGMSKNIPASTMQSNLSKMVGAATVNATPRSQWATNPIFNGNGYLESITVCGIPIKGGVFYENCWLLYSPNFKMSFNGSDTWTFTTNGNGHCVGMSQFGANYLATVNNYGYAQILSHYFPGTNIA
ncbi:MAG: GH25 family lysozyme, partial [Oscillospiraceae bacterium]